MLTKKPTHTYTHLHSQTEAVYTSYEKQIALARHVDEDFELLKTVIFYNCIKLQ